MTFVPAPLPEAALGLPVAETQPLLQPDCFKEVVNKIAWAIGSTYRVPYRSPHTGARAVALNVAQWIIEAQGYPIHIRR